MTICSYGMSLYTSAMCDINVLTKLFKLGEEHEKTKESGDCLKHLTQQAVTLQKRMNEITRNSGSASQLFPLQVYSISVHIIHFVMVVCFEMRGWVYCSKNCFFTLKSNIFL